MSLAPFAKSITFERQDSVEACLMPLYPINRSANGTDLNCICLEKHAIQQSEEN